MSAPPDEGLATVRLLGFPLQVHGRAQQQSQEMRREFQLVLGQEQLHPGSVPARLLDLSAVLSERYAGFTEEQEREIEDGISAGREVLDEADDFCRSGQMLVLATPPDLVRYRNWYLDEFSRQLAGEPPQPWPGPLR